MRIQAHDRDRINKICRHELGHFFVAQQSGFKTNDLTFTFQPFNGHMGEAGLEPNRPGIKSIGDITNYLELRCMILYAGVIAEATDEKGDYNSNYALNQWHNDGGKQDHTKVKELIFLLRGIAHPDTNDNQEIQKQLDTIDLALIQRTGIMIIGNIELIYQAADQLSRRIVLYNTQYRFSSEEIAALLSPKP